MSNGVADNHEQWKPSGNPWLIALAVTLAAFMEVLDTTIVNVALPHIAGSLSASEDDATWTLTSYLVANGIRASDLGVLWPAIRTKTLFHDLHRHVHCVLGSSAGSRPACRKSLFSGCYRGFFGGGLQPNQQSIILDTFKPSQRGQGLWRYGNCHHRSPGSWGLRWEDGLPTATPGAGFS